MSYYGKSYIGKQSFDPNSIIQVNTAATLTSASTNKTYMLNNPANYTLSLPQLSTVGIGETFNFVHNYSTGTVTVAAFAGDTIQSLGISTTTLLVNPGDSIILENINGIWSIVNPNRTWTAPQGTNDNTPASTAFIINEFNKHKNRLINGNFDIWQRGMNFSGAGGNDYTADTWFISWNGTTFTASAQAFVYGQTAVPGNPIYYHRTIVSAVTGANNYCHITQPMESVATLSGQTATYTFWAKADSNKDIAVEFYQNFGTGGAPSASQAAIGVATFHLTTNWQKCSATVNIPSIAGKTTGSNSDNHLRMNIWFSGGANYNGRNNSLAQQSGTFDISQVQVEEGFVSTSFERRSLAEELAMCRRYYENSWYPSTSRITFNGCHHTIASSSRLLNGSNVRFVGKRTIPTIFVVDPTTGAGGNFGEYDNAGNYTLSLGGQVIFAGVSSFSVQMAASNATPGYQYRFHWEASAVL